jgi:protein-S-isoprenylcysteine O-methyltransferase Ste14
MLIAYKAIESLIFIIFFIFIADTRTKHGMKSLVNEKLNILMKLVFLASATAYFYVLISADRLIFPDIIAFILTISGMLITVKAKLDLAGSHTWAGYRMSGSELVTKGIYRYIRHPLYAGIYIFVFGGLAIIIPRLPWFLVVLAAVVAIYFMISLIRRAQLETRLLTEAFGERYLEYKRQVNSFLPVRRYH